MVVESDGSISTKVFRKVIHTDQYLNVSSNHLQYHKRGVVRTLMNRLVTDESELGREKEHTRKDWMLADSHMSDQSDPGQEEEE